MCTKCVPILPLKNATIITNTSRFVKRLYFTRIGNACGFDTREVSNYMLSHVSHIVLSPDRCILLQYNVLYNSTVVTSVGRFFT